MAQWTTIGNSEIQTARRNDAEFFKSEYIDSIAKVRRIPVETLRHLGVEVVSGPFGSSLKSRDYIKEGIPLIRISDLEDFSINRSNLVFISESSHKRIIGSELRQGDLVLSKVGNSIGIVSILDEGFIKANISENNIGIRFRPETTLSQKHFLLTYLNCRFGQNEILRRRSGNAQPKLNISDIYGLEVPMIPEQQQQEIGEVVLQSQIQIKKSKAMYQQAQDLLELQLGLAKLTFQTPVGYIARLSESLGSARFDADYFQPQYAIVRSLVRASAGGYEPLLACCDSLRPNIDPSQTPIKQFDYIELSNINSSLGIIEGAMAGSGNELPSRARRKVKAGDVIASAVVGSVDKVAVVADKQDGFIASTGFFQLRPRNICSEYLLMLVRSQCVLMQFQQQATGGILSAVSDSRLRHVIVPKLPESIQQEIADLVVKSHAAKRGSDNLLAQAKTRVEQLIEAAVQR